MQVKVQLRHQSHFLRPFLRERPSSQSARCGLTPSYSSAAASSISENSSADANVEALFSRFFFFGLADCYAGSTLPSSATDVISRLSVEGLSPSSTPFSSTAGFLDLFFFGLASAV